MKMMEPRLQQTENPEQTARNGFVRLNRTEEAKALLAKHPNAFLLLSQIALRARWKDCPIQRLKVGEAFIGDWKEAGLKSQKAYRHAKVVLERARLVAFKGANKGTIASLVNYSIFDPRPYDRGEQEDNLGASKGRTKGEQGATNNKDKKKSGNRENYSPNQNSKTKPVDTGKRKATIQ